MSVEKEEFRDPALKEAVRRCWASDCAPERLRLRVTGLLVEKNQSAILGRPANARRSWILWPTALAALLLISVGLFDHYHISPQSVASAADLPVALETDLIRTHDRCCHEANHHKLSVAKNDDTAIAAALRTQLKRAVLVCHPRDPGWTFRGASVCDVGSTPSGHLVFIKGDVALSIFSLPTSILPGASEGNEYACTVDQHCIVGFVKAGGLFCVVESGPAGTINANQLQQMSRDMKPAVAMQRAPDGIALAELLRPVRH